MRGLLREAGYLVLVRTNGWTECFVQRGCERWEGRGHTEAEALDDALVKMLPSNLSRQLFERVAARHAVEGGDGPAAVTHYAPITTAIIEAPGQAVGRPRALDDDHAEASARLAGPEGATEHLLTELATAGDALDAPPESGPRQPLTTPRLAPAEALQALQTETAHREAPDPLAVAPILHELHQAPPVEAVAPLAEVARDASRNEPITMGDPERVPHPPPIADTSPIAALIAIADAPPANEAAPDKPGHVGGAPQPPNHAASPAPAVIDHAAGTPAHQPETPKPPAQPVAVAPAQPETPKPPAQPAAHDAGPVQRAVAPAPASPVVSPRLRTAEAVESVERMLVEIEERLGHLARMCGERQRLHMMVWICRARAVEEAHPGIRDVEQAVARVARRLTDIGKMFWPGSVRALQLSARPADVRREMHATWAAEPANWREATVLAERLLEEHLAKSPDAGLDEDGWADSAARTPRPADPDALLEQVDAEIKAILVPSGEVPNGRAGDLSNAEFERLLDVARKLRWVRGGVQRDLDWGVAVGRMRRAIPSLGDRAGRVRDVLDHRTKPPVPWAKLLGEAPEPAAPPGESPEDLRAALPAAIVTKDTLLAWLIRAFDVLNTPDLVGLLVPIKHILADFSEETLNHPDRRVRRRLRDLVKRLATATDAPAPVKEEPVEETTIDEPVAEHALTALAARVRAQTHGKKALFVSNREDPELGSRLEELLGIHIAWCDGSLRRVQAQCERIKGGSYDLILSATGFQVHGVDSALARAASAGSVPYVRVNRGRPVACVQAIAREFGMKPEMSTGTYKTLDPNRAKVS